MVLFICTYHKIGRLVYQYLSCILLYVHFYYTDARIFIVILHTLTWRLYTAQTCK